MKKNLLFAAVMAVALSSCSKNEVMVDSTDPSNAIGFGTYVGSATKVDVETKFENDDVFVIDAYYTAEDAMKDATPAKFMQNQTVTASTKAGTLVDTWTYSPIKYWPNNTNDMVSFFAVTNATAASPISDFEALSGTTPSFKVASATTDVMIASALNQKKGTAAGKVAFEFQHTMAQVLFKAKLAGALAANSESDDKTVVEITSLSVDYGTAACAGGTFTFDDETANTGAWSDATGTRSADTWATDGSDGIGTELNTTLAAIGQPIMILPFSSAYTVTVVYTVVTTDDDDTENGSEITNTTTFEITPSAMNTIYTYNLSIDLTEVEVSGSIAAGWGTSSENVTIDASTVTL